jgi:NRAMP (natural resistance-associated macrophage protein)-like metal ion transporter
VSEIIPSAECGAREAGVRAAPNAFMRVAHILGPGITVGASDDDPSGVGTYSIAGASLGFSTLWLALFTLPMMATVQFISAKMALVTGEGLGALLRRHYPQWIGVALALGLFAANTLNAGADIGAIAASFNLLIPKLPVVALVVPIGVALLVLQFAGSYQFVAALFKWLSLALFSYVIAAFFAHPHWGEVLRGTFLPSFRFGPKELTTLVAILGTTISPYMIYWQASQEVEEDIALGRRFLWQRQGTTAKELRYAAIDICTGMVFSNLVMYFIIVTTGATLYASGHRDIATAADAARALTPLAGPGATWLFAAGMIGVGALAVPILTASSGYALAEAFGWKSGLRRNPTKAPHFYTVIAASTLVGIEINFLGIGAIAALFWSAVVNGVLAPILLVAVMLLAGNRAVMTRPNGPLLTAAGWATTVVMGAAAILLFVFWGR